MDRETRKFVEAARNGPKLPSKPKPKTEKWDLYYNGVRVQGAIAAPYGVCMAEKAKLKRLAGFRENLCKIKAHTH